MSEPEYVTLEELVARVWEWSLHRAFDALNYYSPVPTNIEDGPRGNKVTIAVNGGAVGMAWADGAGSYGSLRRCISHQNHDPYVMQGISEWEIGGRSAWSVVRIDQPDLFAAWVAEARRAQTLWVMSGANGGEAL